MDPAEEPTPRADARSVAVLVDAENVVAWCDGVRLERILAEAAAFGPVRVRRAYGNWAGSASGLVRELNRLGFDLAHVYHPTAGKNSADIQMTVDAMDLLVGAPAPDTFVLVTGDSDFSPLFRRLRERGREVVGCGPRSSMSETVRSSCARFLYAEDLPRRAPGPSAGGAPVPATRHTAPAAPARRTPPPVAGAPEDAALLARAATTLARETNPSVLLTALRALDPTFDAKARGYGTLLAFLRLHPTVVTVRVDAYGTPWVRREDAAGPAAGSSAGAPAVRGGAVASATSSAGTPAVRGGAVASAGAPVGMRDDVAASATSSAGPLEVRRPDDAAAAAGSSAGVPAGMRDDVAAAAGSSAGPLAVRRPDDAAAAVGSSAGTPAPMRDDVAPAATGPTPDVTAAYTRLARDWRWQPVLPAVLARAYAALAGTPGPEPRATWLAVARAACGDAEGRRALALLMHAQVVHFVDVAAGVTRFAVAPGLDPAALVDRVDAALVGRLRRAAPFHALPWAPDAVGPLLLGATTAERLAHLAAIAPEPVRRVEPSQASAAK